MTSPDNAVVGGIPAKLIRMRERAADVPLGVSRASAGAGRPGERAGRARGGAGRAAIRSSRQLWREVAELGLERRSALECLLDRRGVRGRTLARIVAGKLARREERPVARLEREQLAQRARGWPAPARRATVSSAVRACQASSATAGPLQVRRSPPSPQLLTPRSLGAGTGSA